MKRILLSFITLLFAHAMMAQCNPAFTSASAPSGNNLLNVSFTNTTSFTSTSTNAYYTIKFGDGGQTSLFSTTTHNYSAPGTYTVKLIMTVLDSLTQAQVCKDSITHLVTVAYPPCGVTFSQTVSSNGSTTFTASNPASTPGITYSWNFGDGNTGTGSPVTHVYAANGVYNVTVTSNVSSIPCSYTNSHTVPITNIVPAGCTGHTASFSYGGSGFIVNVYNTSPNFSGQLKTASWTFGDGGTGTGNNANHTYASAGTYTITMTCTWTDSATSVVACTNTSTQTVTITGTTGPNMMQGHIFVDSVANPGIDTFKVWLITYNASTSMLEAVDSTMAVGMGGANYYFQGKPAGTYLAKAKFMNSANSSVGYLPTYHLSNVYWSGATNIVHTGGNTVKQAHNYDTGHTNNWSRLCRWQCKYGCKQRHRGRRI
jgi:PKD repeat protein